MLRLICRHRIELALLVTIGLIGATVHATNRALETRTTVVEAPGDVGPLPDGKALRVLSLGFDRLVADLFWLRTVYYVGDERSHAAGYPSAEPLAQLVTDIDPGFQSVYVLMSSALSGLGGDPDAAIRLLEKGTQHVSYWKIHFLLGFNYFLEKLDFARAAEQIQRADELEGGPFYLPLLAARLYAQSGNPETAMAFIQARLSEAETPEIRESLEKRYWDLWINRDLSRIDAAIATYREREGRGPADVEALVVGGLLDRVPEDPRGGRYSIREGRAATDLEYDTLEVHRSYSPRTVDYQREVEQLQRAHEGGQE